MNIVQVPSPNYGDRRGRKPVAIVLHLMDGTLVGTDAWFQLPTSKVSAHYGVGKNGEIHQYVDEGYAAWHAGVVDTVLTSLPAGNPNTWSIGIECEGTRKDTSLPQALYDPLSTLVADICTRWGIPLTPQAILLHREIYRRKACPGCLDRDVVLTQAKEKMK